jgi:hypothetical protein
MPSYRLADAQKEIAKLARKAEKRGLPVPTIEIIGTETRTDDAGEETHWTTVRLLGAAPILNGWRCLATIVPWTEQDGTARGTLYTAPEVTEDPAWLERPGHCDHCNTNRRRALTFVLAHDDGRVVQVGRTCLNDYLGVDALASWFVWSELREFVNSGWGDYSYSLAAEWLAANARAAARADKATRLRSIPLVDFVAATLAHIRTRGYMSGCGQAIWKAVAAAEHVAPTADEQTLAATIAAELPTLAGDSDFAVRVRVTASKVAEKGVMVSHANVIAGAVRGYSNRLAVPSSPALNECLPAEIGDEVTVDLIVVRDLGWALSCADEQGRTVLVRTRELARPYPAEGGRVRVTATVRTKDLYRGTRQTILEGARVV